MDTSDDNDFLRRSEDRVDGDEIAYKTREWRGTPKNNPYCNTVCIFFKPPEFGHGDIEYKDWYKTKHMRLFRIQNLAIFSTATDV